MAAPVGECEVGRVIKVDIKKQELALYKNDLLIARYRISTAKNGGGQQYGSMQTPLGDHRIYAKIGEGAPIGTVFRGRVPTGEIYTPQLEVAQAQHKDWIITRILWLEGIEEGFNKGGNVDSKARKIYIHASPDSRPMGTPYSHGCVCLHNQDMVNLFEQVTVGVMVNIT